jgi:sodium transport system ATP-binding protein
LRWRPANTLSLSTQRDSSNRVIHVEGLCKTFLDYQRGLVSAVSHVSFDCRPGEIFGLLGPNGAGKTTTLRILSTVLRPTGGRAMVAGYDVVTEAQAVRSNIGYMSASTGIYDRMTAWELVEYFGRLYGLPPDRLRDRMETIFDWLRMNDFRDVLGSKMSTGMKQKVSIARTIVHDPPVLIFDEPTSGLDVLVQRVVVQRIIELRDLGKTIIFSTHSMHEVQRLCQRVAIIHKGKLQVVGAPRELLEQFDQPDLEELFFTLVERADRQPDVALEPSAP